MTTTALAVAAVALAVACGALTLAVVVMRQNATTTTALRRHRNAHHRAEGFADPEPENDAPPARGSDRRATPIDPERAAELGGYGLPGARTAHAEFGDPHRTVEAPAPRPLPGQVTR